MTLHEVLKDGATNIELIDVISGNQPVSLMRFKEMPEFAFVMWVKNPAPTSGRSMVVFRNKAEGFRVVCLCCYCKGSGIAMPPSGDKEKEHSEWARIGRTELKKALLPVCKKEGICTLFFRHAEFWKEGCGTEEIDGVEAGECKEALHDLYGRKVIENTFHSIDRERSDYIA